MSRRRILIGGLFALLCICAAAAHFALHRTRCSAPQAMPLLPPAPAAGANQPLNPYPNPEDQPADVSFAFNRQWARPGPYQTALSPRQEADFQAWAGRHPQAVAGELNNPQADYDVRGHWLAAQQHDPAATLRLNRWDGKMHGSDKFKTPYNGSFSNESMYAAANAPHWQGDRLITQDGRLVADETPRRPALNRP